MPNEVDRVKSQCARDTPLLPLFKNRISPLIDRQATSVIIQESPLSPQLNKLLTWVSLIIVFQYIQLCKVWKKPNIRPIGIKTLSKKM